MIFARAGRCHLPKSLSTILLQATEDREIERLGGSPRMGWETVRNDAPSSQDTERRCARLASVPIIIEQYFLSLYGEISHIFQKPAGPLLKIECVHSDSLFPCGCWLSSLKGSLRTESVRSEPF